MSAQAAAVPVESFGAQLRRYRTRAGLSIERLAAVADLSPHAVGQLERGGHLRPHAATATALATALRLDGDARAAFLVDAMPPKPAPKLARLKGGMPRGAMAVFVPPLPATVVGGGAFAQALHRHRVAAGLSQNALGKLASINASYVNRMESGERAAPTRQVALALAGACGLDATARDGLLEAAGYLSERAAALVGAGALVAGLAKLLASPAVDEAAKERAGREVRQIARDLAAARCYGPKQHSGALRAVGIRSWRKWTPR